MSRLIGLLLLLLSTASQSEVWHYVGTARLNDAALPVYSERYADYLDGRGRLLKSIVTYTLPDGSPLADKQLDYRNHPYAPDFQFFNRKTGYQEGIEWLGDGRIRLHQQTGTERQETVVVVEDPVVADAGFNQFMRDQLSNLRDGQAVDFNFLNPARLTWYRFSARLTSSSATRISVSIAPANRVLRWLVDPIELTYSVSDGRLLQYHGLTNVSLEGNTTIKATIDYEYQDSEVSTLLPRHEQIKYLPTLSEG